MTIYAHAFLAVVQLLIGLGSAYAGQASLALVAGFGFGWSACIALTQEAA